MTNQVTNAEPAPSAWKSLYKVSSVAALIGAAMLLIVNIASLFVH